MPICYAINRNLSKREYFVILLGLLAMLAGCSNSEEQAAQSAAQAQSLLQQNRIAEARLTIKEAILAKDDVSEYHIIRGRIEFADEAFENAFAAYSEALALDAANPEALQAVSQLGLRVGRYAASIDATDKLLVLNPGQKEAMLTKGLHAMIKRNYDEALTFADKILAIDGLDEGGVVLKARASFLSGNASDATLILDRYETSQPNTMAVSLTRLEIYRELRNAEQMDKQFNELERLLPDDLALRLDEANFRYKTGDTAYATSIVGKVMASKKATPEYISNAIGLWREYSITTLDGAVARSIAKSGRPGARIAGARYFADVGDLATARLFLQGMSGPDADGERAYLAMLSGNNPLAKSTSDAILAADATHCSALGTRAKLSLENGKPAAALISAQRASSECTDQPYLWQLTAEAYSGLRDYTNARRVFRQGIEANKQSEPLARAYAFWSIMRGNDREAVAVARRLTRSAPALASGWRLYAEICTKAKANCTTEANQGLIDSKTRYGIDLLPGELPPNGLFGRFVIR
jgi:tetratricopeptide (TPR) repeat protein